MMMINFILMNIFNSGHSRLCNPPRHSRMFLAGICGLVIRFRLKATGMTLVGAIGMTMRTIIVSEA
jgi:hypothetical protein